MATETLATLDTTTAPGDPRPVRLGTRRDFNLVTQALEHRQGELEKLAKKNRDEGYIREARIVDGDASTIKQQILPQFADQQELPLVTPERLQAAIAEELRPVVRGALLVRAPEEKVGVVVRDQETALCQNIAQRMESFVRELAESAWQAGYTAREEHPLAIAMRSLHVIGHG